MHMPDISVKYLNSEQINEHITSSIYGIFGDK